MTVFMERVTKRSPQWFPYLMVAMRKTGIPAYIEIVESIQPQLAKVCLGDVPKVTENMQALNYLPNDRAADHADGAGESKRMKHACDSSQPMEISMHYESNTEASVPLLAANTWHHTEHRPRPDDNPGIGARTGDPCQVAPLHEMSIEDPVRSQAVPSAEDTEQTYVKNTAVDHTNPTRSVVGAACEPDSTCSIHYSYGPDSVNQLSSIEANSKSYEDKIINISGEDDLASIVDNTEVHTAGSTHSSPVPGPSRESDDGNPELGSTTEEIKPPEVEPEELKLRPYQEELAAPAIEGDNVIIVAPTGSGKTHVALAITQAHLAHLASEEQGEGKVAFLVPTIELVSQQWKQYKRYLSQYQSYGLSGEIQDNQRVPLSEMLPSNDVIIMTPQVMVNALERGTLVSLGQFTLIIFDECHHTAKQHPYNTIMSIYMEEKLKPEEEITMLLPQVIGLTASVGVGKARDVLGAVDHILQLCANMDAVHPVTVKLQRKELDKHVNRPQEQKIETHGRLRDPFKEKISEIMNNIEIFMRNHAGVREVQEIQNFDKMLTPPSTRGSDPYIQWVSRLLKAFARIYDQKISRPFNACRNHLQVYNIALMINADCRTKDALEYIVKESKEIEMGFKDATDIWLEKQFKDRRPALQEFSEDARFENPKLQKLKEKLIEQYEKNADMRAIIFTKTLDMTLALKNWMQSTPQLKMFNAHRVTGSRASSDKGGMTLHQQEDALQYFKDGKHQVIIATSVAEEGLDVRKCDLVIRYEYVTNEIAMVQARGRARAEDATYITVGEKGRGTKEKETINKIRENLMNKALIQVMEMNSDQRKDKIWRFQKEASVERQMLETEKRIKDAKKERFRVDTWSLNCLKCQQLACLSSDLRKVQDSHHVVLDDTFLQRVKLEKHPNPKTYDEFQKTHKVFCSKCKYDWGIVCLYKGVQFPVLKIVSFVMINKKNNHRDTCKKWKDAPFAVNKLTPEELQAQANIMNEDNDQNM